MAFADVRVIGSTLPSGRCTCATAGAEHCPAAKRWKALTDFHASLPGAAKVMSAIQEWDITLSVAKQHMDNTTSNLLLMQIAFVHPRQHDPADKSVLMQIRDIIEEQKNSNLRLKIECLIVEYMDVA